MRIHLQVGLSSIVSLVIAFITLQGVLSAGKSTCVHDVISKNYKPKKERISEAKARSLAAVPHEWHPLNIMFDYSGLEDLDPVKAKFIMNDLMPAVAIFFKSFVSVKVPKEAKWAVSADSCFGVQVPTQYQMPVLTGDLLIFVTYKNEPGGYIAWATSCLLDAVTNRPKVGVVNFRFDEIDTSPVKFEGQFRTVVHEFIHVLALSYQLFEHYIDKDGKTIGKDKVVKDVVIRDSPTKIIILPEIVELTRDYFKCYIAEGAELENQGDEGSRGSHWERRNYMNELMTSSLQRGFLLTNLTLTLMEATGWYKIDKSVAQHMHWGKGKRAGCKFLFNDCLDNKGRSVYYGFCQKDQEETCTHNRYAKGFCEYADNPDLKQAVPEAFDYVHGKKSHDPFADNCPYPQAYYNGECSDQKNFIPQLSAAFDETFGAGSRCFEGNFFKKDFQLKNGLKNHASCQKYTCLRNSENKWYVRIHVGQETIECPRSGGEMTIPGYVGSIICPKGSIFCKDEMKNECPHKEFCNYVGLCYRNECICPPGFEGPTCKPVHRDCAKTKCSNNGKCENNACVCNDGWGGADCSDKAISTTCSSCSHKFCYGEICLKDLETLFDSEHKPALELHFYNYTSIISRVWNAVKSRVKIPQIYNPFPHLPVPKLYIPKLF